MNRILDIGYCLSVPEKNDGCFIIKDVLGKGASSVTYLAECNQTEHVLKECNPLGLHMHRDNDGTLVPDTELNKIKFEEYLSRFVNGATKQLSFRLTDDLKNTTSNIQAIYHANGTVYIDMTYFNGDTYDNIAEESLYDLLRRMKALAQIIGHYHDMGYLHLDVKPQNIYAIPETPEMLMMFDFDSVVPIADVEKMVTLSYTDTWAAPEQKMAKYRRSICKATDLFAIGEIIFHRVMGRHSNTDERFDFSKYDYDKNAPIFANVNVQVYSLLDELFRQTLCMSPNSRFQTAEELLALLDKMIPLADPQKPALPRNCKNIVPKDGFIGRDTEIQEIHTRLQYNPILFLHGIGGIGKSELAKQYAARYQSEYDTVFFAPYDTDIVFLIANDSSITINNFSRFENEAVEKYYERKLKVFKELISCGGERALLIVDNLDTCEDKNIKILFELGCRVLITSRVDLGTTFMRPQMEVKAFSDIAISRELFRQYYQFSDAEATDVDAIINLVQGHTLAIELIAKQVEAEWSTVQKIREKLESGGLSSIGEEDIDSLKDDDLSQDSAFGHIKALFDLSVFEKDNKDNELYVLTNLSLMPFSGIDRDWFANWCDLDNHGSKSCVRRLVKSGWLYDNGKNISVHPLVANVCLASRKEDSVFNTFVANINKQIAIEKVCDSNEIVVYPPMFVNMFSCIKQCRINTEIIFSFLWNVQRWLNDNTAMKSAVENIMEYVITYDKNQSADFYRRRIGLFISVLKYNIACFGDENQREEKLKYWEDVYKNLPVDFCGEPAKESTDLKIQFEGFSTQVTYFQDIGDRESEFALYEKIITTYESAPAFELDRLSQQEGTFEDVFYDIASAYEKLEQYDSAITIYKKSLDAIPAGLDAKHLWDKERVYQSLLACLTISENWEVLDVVSQQYFEWATKIYPQNHPKYLCAMEYLLVSQASPLMLCFSDENEFDGFFRGMYDACLKIEHTFHMFCDTCEKISSYAMPNYLLKILTGVAHMIFGYVLLFLERTADDYKGSEPPPTDMNNPKALQLLLFVKSLFEKFGNEEGIESVCAFIEYTELLLK